MFESDLLDVFSRTHPLVVPLLFLPASLCCLWEGVVARGVGAGAAALLFLAGAAVWSLAEYWLHRTFFHWTPPGPLGRRLHYLVHGVHHTWPRDKYRLVMPPAVSVTLFFVFFAIFRVVLGPRAVFPFHAGFAIGYMSYDLIHYAIHHHNPRWKYALDLKKHHMLHHFKSPDARFGVSSRLWDRVFGTL